MIGVAWRGCLAFKYLLVWPAGGDSRRRAVRRAAARGERRTVTVAMAVTAAGAPRLGLGQRQLQAAAAGRLLRLVAVVLPATKIVAVVIVVVAQSEEPHEPHDERPDVEDSESDHEDPALQRHPGLTVCLRPRLCKPVLDQHAGDRE